MKEFGKEIRFLGELTVTGNKVGMGTQEYACLIHNEEFFRKIARIIRYQSILDELKIDAVPVNESEAEVLISSVMNLAGECMPCFIGHNAGTAEILLEYATDQHNFDKRVESARDEWAKNPESNFANFLSNNDVDLSDAFCKMLTIGLIELGIHPAELTKWSLAFEWNDKKERLYLARDNSCNPSKAYLADAIRNVVELRRVMAAFKGIFFKEEDTKKE